MGEEATKEERGREEEKKRVAVGINKEKNEVRSGGEDRSGALQFIAKQAPTCGRYAHSR